MSSPKRWKVSARKCVTIDLAHEKLRSSGIDESAATALMIDAVDDATALDPSLDHLPALIFTYFYPDGKPVPREIYYRIRYLSQPDRGGWTTQVEASKGNRYRQPKGSPCWVYLPRTLLVNGELRAWSDILKPGVEEIVSIAEGELKAAKACIEGIPTIGLGGVTAFSMLGSRGIDRIPPLMAGDEFRGVPAHVVFDSDEPEGLKEKVRHAAVQLMSWLAERGAYPALVTLPFEGEKTGLDDFLVRHGADKYRRDLEIMTVPFEAGVDLLKKTDEWGYVEPIDQFVRMNPAPNESGFLICSTEHFNRVTGDMQIAIRRKHREKVGGGWGLTTSLTPVNLSTAMLASPLTKRFKGLVFRPGEPQVVDDYFNIWMGFRCEYEGPRARIELPDAATRRKWVDLWHRMLDVVFDDEPEGREFVERWLIGPLRDPTMIINTFVMVWGEQGVGKTFHGEMFAKHVYGCDGVGPRHGWIIAPGELERDFNPYAFGTRFLLAEEVVTSAARRDIDERLKALITMPSLTINLKGRQEFRMDNAICVWGSSNSELAVATTRGARRPFIHRAPDRGLEFKSRWDELSAGFASGAAAASILHHARQSQDAANLLDGFDPKAAPPRTEAREIMDDLSMYPEERWVRDLVENARDGHLSRIVASASEIAALYHKENGMESSGWERRSADSFGRILSRVGCRYAGSSRKIQFDYKNDGSRIRAWCLTGGRMSLSQAMDQFAQSPVFERKIERMDPMKRKAKM